MSDQKCGTKVCNKCKQEKTHIPKLSRGGNRGYVELNGLRWANGICSSCLSERNKARYRAREARVYVDKAAEIIMSGRSCRKCGTQLNVSRYFYCNKCRPEELTTSDEMIYWGDDLVQEKL